MSLAGQLLYLGYHRPLAALRRSRREGGPWQQWLDRSGRLKMIAAAKQLPPVLAPTPDASEICFLTGRRFWYQTAFCAFSLQRAAEERLRFIFCDDGTLDEAVASEARRIFPGCRLRSAAEIAVTLDQHLPVSRFPVLRQHRQRFILLRKITDIHAGHRGWRLFLDSDMLFFHRPAELLEWLAAPDRPVHLVDIGDAYGYALDTLDSLAGRQVPRCVNTGICAFSGDAIDWPQLEAWCAELLQEHGSSYYLEQALTALLLAPTHPLRLPRPEYLVLPDPGECLSPRAAMHHYVDLSKRGYFRHAWRQIARL